MSVKIDTPQDAYNLVKERCENFVSRVIMEPTFAVGVVGVALAVIIAVIAAAISIRKMQLAKLPKIKPRRTSRK